MKATKLIALFAVFVLLLCSCASSNNNIETTSDVTKNEITLSLPFSATDSLNPYVAVTKVNQELSMLMYDPLIKLNEKFEPVYYLADDITVDEKTVTIKIKDADFTDGAKFTAADVEYSLNQAQKGVNRYTAQLENIRYSTVLDSKTLTLTLYEVDPYIIIVLDFPIFKSGTAETKDKNDRIIPPIGCGRFTFEKENGYRLVSNKGYYGGVSWVSAISLIDTPDNESLNHIIEVNAVDAAYSDLSNNLIPKMSGSQKSLPLGNMVFVGLNLSSNLLSDPGVRIAVSSAMSRKDIAKSAYFGYATPATGIFPPTWKEAEELQHINSEQNISEAVAYLEQLGYNSKDNDGYCTDEIGNRLTLSLIYNSGNSSRKYVAGLIVGYLKKIGIEVIVEEIENFDEYQSRIDSGSYEMYIGEVLLGKTMDLRDLFLSDVLGGTTETYTNEMVSAFYDGTADMSTVISAFVSEMPIIPLCYRSGVFVHSRKITDDPNISLSDIYSFL